MDTDSQSGGATSAIQLDTKVCFACKTAKPRAEFHTKPDSLDGLRSRCIPCEREYTRAHDHDLKAGRATERPLWPDRLKKTCGRCHRVKPIEAFLCTDNVVADVCVACSKSAPEPKVAAGADGEKVCLRCHRSLPFKEFHRHRAIVTGPADCYARCIACTDARRALKAERFLVEAERDSSGAIPTAQEGGSVSDPINPQHYTSIGEFECIDIAELLGFNLGNAFKYIWRVGSKSSSASVDDLKKAHWYAKRSRKEPPNDAIRRIHLVLLKAVSSSFANDNKRVALLENIVEASFDPDMKSMLIGRLEERVEDAEAGSRG
jgi:hypothetical protein